ncbi:hypothetical protein [uncultured Cyclobacterium sp.]|uniref:hypothetical protein n=1 Tax=uncultured Cyclobacterium sp. TaxID=453820 RepID=UPI0030EF9639|tara:strand:- start:800 stop:1156 length:357 start_codon:yes stop_codon:yes gene_type:complete
MKRTKLKEDFVIGGQFTAENANEINRGINEAFDELELLEKRLKSDRKTFNKRVDNFYGKIIEIFGIFIAIFSIITVAAQSSFKCEGNFITRLFCSASIFIPIIISLIVLILLVHFLKR